MERKILWRDCETALTQLKQLNYLNNLVRVSSGVIEAYLQPSMEPLKGQQVASLLAKKYNVTTVYYYKTHSIRISYAK